jgi:hypothetical protein
MWVGGTTSQNHLERVRILGQFTSVGITFFETPASVLRSVRLPATTLKLTAQVITSVEWT